MSRINLDRIKWYASIEKLTSEKELTYDRDGKIGWGIILVDEVPVFKRVLPSYMIASIEVWDRGSSMAETSDMPEMLAERLTPKEDPAGEVFERFFADYVEKELSIIRSVLEVIVSRRDFASVPAQVAIDRYWHAFPSLLCN